MATLGDLLALLHDGETSWTTLRGEVREWRDQALVHRAFMAEARAKVSRTFSLGRSPTPEVTESRYSVWVSDHRVRVERPRSHEARPELLVRLGDDWWSYHSESGAVSNAGVQGFAFGTGGDEFRAHLRPWQFVTDLRWEVTGEDVVAGRDCTFARAERRPPYDNRQLVPPIFEMITGGSTFEIAVDAERGVLLRVAKLVDGSVAELREFLAVEYDRPISDELFAFATPDGSPVQDFDTWRHRVEGRAPAADRVQRVRGDAWRLPPVDPQGSTNSSALRAQPDEALTASPESIWARIRRVAVRRRRR